MESGSAAAPFSAFMEASSEVVGLCIPSGNAEGVRMHLVRIAEIAAPLLTVEIPDEVESAGVFEP